jgi:methyl-accepting chemotaxis protein
MDGVAEVRWNSIRVKVMAAFAIILMLYAVISNVYAGSKIKAEVIIASQHKLKSDFLMAKALVDQSFPGEWAQREGKLYKGDALMHDRNELMDRIGEYTGGTITIFLNNVRVSTNVMNEGKRAVGSPVSKQVEEQVLVGEKEFVGEALVVGTKYQTIYEPIRDRSGKVIGIFYVGIPDAPFQLLVTDFTTHLLWLSAAALLVCLAVSYALSRSTLRSIGQLAAGAHAIAQGNLTIAVEVRRKDELGDLSAAFEQMRGRLSQMLGNLRDMSVNLKQNSEYMSEAARQSEVVAEEVAVSVQHIAEGASEQNERLLDIRSQMHSTSEQMTIGEQHVEETLQNAEEAYEAAEKGQAAIEQASQHLASLLSNLHVSSDAMSKLNERSRAIESIVLMIKEISEQTNLLSLNAAIEAARAGEHGLGFAVVAQQVRKLADESKQAASQIASLIQDVLQRTAETSESMEASMAAVDEQQRFMLQGQAALQDIVSHTEETREQAVRLSEVFGQVLQYANETMKAVERIGSVVENNAAAAEQVAASAQEQTATVAEISSSSRGVKFIAFNLERKVQEFVLEQQ